MVRDKHILQIHIKHSTFLAKTIIEDMFFHNCLSPSTINPPLLIHTSIIQLQNQGSAETSRGAGARAALAPGEGWEDFSSCILCDTKKISPANSKFTSCRVYRNFTYKQRRKFLGHKRGSKWLLLLFFHTVNHKVLLAVHIKSHARLWLYCVNRRMLTYCLAFF